MECRYCDAEFEGPAGKSFHIDEVFPKSVDVDLGAKEYVQLECPECGAVLGYAGHAAAVGSTDTRGYY